MKVVALVSGGKDSCYAMMRCIDYGHQIVALANLLPSDDAVDELDSYMYQTVGHQIVTSYAKCMGLPLFRRRIQGSTRHQELSYKVTDGDEVEDLFILLNEIKQQIPSVTAVSSGAIASDYQRIRVESVCSRLGLVSLAYLWKQDQTLLLQEMIKKGIVAILIKVAAIGLVPAKHLGKELSFMYPQLLQMKERYGINVCGEGGEYETLTLDCPLFTNARIVLDKFEVVLHSPDSIAAVGILHPMAFHLEQKGVASSFKTDANNYANSECMGYVMEIDGKSQENCPYISRKCPYNTDKMASLSISRTKSGMFTIGCWMQDSSSGGLKEDLFSLLITVEVQLMDDSFDWENVLYVHLYISSMKDFALANDIYVSFITENKCPSGVPSRSTIEVPLAQAGLGNAYVEVLVSSKKTKRVLHVQSISCWAPSCIGPYSQATLHGEILYMAGQLGLDPPTMTLVPGGSTAELEQSLENCEAVANSFSSSITSSAVLFCLYCSISLTLYERIELEQKLRTLLEEKAFQLENGGPSRNFNPIFLYVLASNLPKGASVEVKPVLHVPENAGENVHSISTESARNNVLTYWGFEYSDWHDSCYEKRIIGGKICVALVSITRDLADKICSLQDQKSVNTQCNSSVAKMNLVARFCIYLLDKILIDNGFSWQDLVSLRIYFNTGVYSAADLSLSFSTAFEEFTESSKRIGKRNKQIFNLIPVLGSARSAMMDDLVTCEIFAITA